MFILHHIPDTAAMPVRIVLEHLGLPYQARLIDRAGGELASPAYRALHPLGKIPVLETPEGPMFETAALLLWLADTHGPGQLAPAPDAPNRGAFLTWLFFASSNLHPAVLDCFYSDRVAGPEAVPALLPRAADRAAQALAALEAAAGAAPDLFPTDRPGILPLYIGTLMRWQAQLPDGHPGLTRSQGYPALRAALAASESCPAARRVAQTDALGPTIFTDPDR
jgi:glutathione S-transferase